MQDVEPLTRLCHTIGPCVVRPLAIALAAEENNRADPPSARAAARVRRRGTPVGRAAQDTRPTRRSGARRSICCACSAAARRCRSSRRCSTTPIRRCSASRSAPSCRSARMRPLPCSNRRSSAAAPSRDTILQQLIGLRDDKAIPLLCYVLDSHGPAWQARTRARADHRSARAASRRTGLDSRTLRDDPATAASGGHRSARPRSGRRRPPRCAASARRRRWPCCRKPPRTAAAACANAARRHLPSSASRERS